MKVLRAIALISLLMTACKPVNEEERTARNFLRSLSEGDYENARNYVVTSSFPLLFDFVNIGVTPDSLRAHPIAWSIDSMVKYTADSARVYYLWNGLPEQMRLVKEKGHWKVIF